MPYMISDGDIPVGSRKVFECPLDPMTEAKYRRSFRHTKTGSGRILEPSLRRVAEQFLHVNPKSDITVVVERNPNYIPISSYTGELPSLKVAVYLNQPI